MASNQAAWLEEKQGKLVVKSAPSSKPGADEIIIENKAWAINPVDWKMQDYGYFVDKYPIILGCDLAGTVSEVGSLVKTFKPGDRVAAHPIGLATKENKSNAFQQYTVVSSKATVALPSNITFEAASAFPLSVSTAAHGLYSKDFLGLPYPNNTVKPTGKTLLVSQSSEKLSTSRR